MVVTPFNIGIPITQEKDTQTISQDFLQYLTSLETEISSMGASMGSFIAPGAETAEYTTNASPGWLIDPVENTNGINVTSLAIQNDAGGNAEPAVWITTSTSPTDEERINTRTGANNNSIFQNIFLPTGFGIRMEERHGLARYDIL